MATPPVTIFGWGIEPCRGGPVTYASSFTCFWVSLCALLKGNGVALWSPYPASDGGDTPVTVAFCNSDDGSLLVYRVWK